MRHIPSIGMALIPSMALVIGSMGGCATITSASTPANVNAAADTAYIAVATLTPSKAWPAWNLLQVERAGYVAVSGVTAPTALDLQADALRPAGAPPPVFLLATEKPLTQEEAASKLEDLANKAKGH